jgi:hypothetical protein
LPVTLATGRLEKRPARNVRWDTCTKRAAQSREARDVWNSLTIEGLTLREEVSHFREV